MRGRSEAFSKATKRHKRTASAQATGPAVNPRSIELALLLWMSPPEGSECEESRKRLSALESEIASFQARASLKKLVTAGCDRGTLLRSLGFSCGKPVDFVFDNWFTKLGPQSLEGLVGLDGRAFAALRDALLKAADRIDDINRRFEFGILLTTPHLQFFQPLPRLLRGYVSLLDLAAKRLGRGAHFYRNMAKGILILYVKRKTGRFHDKEVSELLAAVSDKDKYDMRRHCEWREEHKALLDRLSPLIPIFTSHFVRSALKSLSERQSPRTFRPQRA